MRKLIAAALFLTATAALAQTHTMTFTDLAAIRRIGAPKLSPDGKWIAYDASTIDMKTNYRRSAIYLMPAAGGESKKNSEGLKQDEGPVWSPDGRTLAYVSDQAGDSKQIWLYFPATGTQRKLPDIPGGAGSLKWTPDGQALLVVSDVYPDCGVDPECVNAKDAAAAAQPTKARVLTSLMYRHWKAWQAPTRTHILLQPINGSPRDLPPRRLRPPPFSVGGGDEFHISPDASELVFARDTEEHPETSTNADLFITPISSGKAQIRRITTRKGADTSPRYSPDGKLIAYRSQARPGYESDLWELWVYNRATAPSTRL